MWHKTDTVRQDLAKMPHIIKLLYDFQNVAKEDVCIQDWFGEKRIISASIYVVKNILLDMMLAFLELKIKADILTKYGFYLGV